MPYIKKPTSVLAEGIKQKLASSLEIDVALIRDASLINILSKVIAGSVTEVYADIEYLIQQALPNLAEEEGVRIWGNIKKVDWITSRVSTGYIECTGTIGSLVAEDELLTDENGNEYIVKLDTELTTSPVSVLVESVEGGIDKNLDVGAELTFVSTPSNVDPVATVDSDGITGGSDAWTLEEYRSAVLSSFAEPPRGGSSYDYKTWVKEATTVAENRVWTYGYSTHPSTIAKGDVEIYFLNDTDVNNGIPPLAVREYVEAYLDERRPLGMGTCTCPELTIQAATFAIQITPNTVATQTAVHNSLSTLLSNTAPGATVTTGQMNRAISDSVDIEDYELLLVNGGSPTNISSGDRARLLAVDITDITWS